MYLNEYFILICLKVIVVMLQNLITKNKTIQPFYEKLIILIQHIYNTYIFFYLYPNSKNKFFGLQKFK